MVALWSLAGACGGGQSFWRPPATAGTPVPPDASPSGSACWDDCQRKFASGTLDLADCVQACPGVEKRDGACPKDATASCVPDNGQVLLFVVVGAVLVGLALGVGLKLLL